MQKRRICRENCKYALYENFHNHFCPRRKAATFCHPGFNISAQGYPLIYQKIVQADPSSFATTGCTVLDLDVFFFQEADLSYCSHLKLKWNCSDMDKLKMFCKMFERGNKGGQSCRQQQCEVGDVSLDHQFQR